MSMARFLAIGMIALSTTGQIGWGQEEQPQDQQQIEWLRQNRERALESRRRAQEIAVAQQAQLSTSTSAEDELVEAASLIDLTFPGGTLGQLVDAVKQQRPRANIMLIGEAGELRIPAFEVFAVTPTGAILVAKNIADAGRDLQLDTVKARDGSAPTTLVRLARHAAEDYQPSPRRIPIDAPTKAWNLKGWTMGNEAGIQNTLAAIQVGMESYDTPVVLQYHEPSGVLLARGNAQQIAFIDSIIRAAAESATHGMTMDDYLAQLRACENELATAQDELGVIKKRHAAAATAVREARDMQASPTTIAKGEVDVAEAEASIGKQERKILYLIDQHKALVAKIEAVNKEASATR